MEQAAYIFFCPVCDNHLMTDEAHQDDIAGYCSWCNLIFNVDYCKVLFDDGELIEAWPPYDKMKGIQL